MKSILLPALLIATLSTKGQDSISHLSRSSISIAAGANIVYPTIPNTSSYSLHTRIGPWVECSYGYTFYRSSHTSIGAKLGVDYARFEYGVKYGDNDYSSISNVVEIRAGIFLNEKIKKVEWHNEFDLSDELTAPLEAIDGMFLLYQTGVRFKICGNNMLMPMISFPVIDIFGENYAYDMGFSHQWNALFKAVTPFNNIRAGLTITHNFSKNRKG